MSDYIGLSYGSYVVLQLLFFRFYISSKAVIEPILVTIVQNFTVNEITTYYKYRLLCITILFKNYYK